MKIKKSQLREIFRQHGLNEGFLDDVVELMRKLRAKADSVQLKNKILNVQKEIDKLDDDPSVIAILKKYNID